MLFIGHIYFSVKKWNDYRHMWTSGRRVLSCEHKKAIGQSRNDTVITASRLIFGVRCLELHYLQSGGSSEGPYVSTVFSCTPVFTYVRTKTKYTRSITIQRYKPRSSCVKDLIRLYRKFCRLQVKGKAVPLQAWSGPEGSRKLRFPDFMTTPQDGGKVVSLTHRPPLLPGNIPGTHIC